ncbi:MAG: arsinothricin resistance N-acetyltransferase ArsN1 family B [Gammaproteobacteria bacterium]
MIARQPVAGCAIRSASLDDATAVCEIYNHYVLNSVITFEEDPVSPGEMARRIDSDIRKPWLVAEQNGKLVGYAYAMPWKERVAYRFSAESTIYMAHGHAGQGLGTELYRALIEELRNLGIHCVIGGIALPNAVSIALHERLGFEKVAQFREVGWKHGKWIDVGYWQLTFVA